MTALHAVCTGLALGALMWWGAVPKGVEAAGQHPSAAGGAAGRKVDPAAALAVRLTTRGAFGIFPQETPVGALAAGGVSMRLFGTSISPGRQAALISAGGARPVWLVMGEPQTGVELVDLAPGRAVIRTSTGDTITLALFPAKASPAAAGPEEVSHGG